jgi:SAM-dependent methyltransferase
MNNKKLISDALDNLEMCFPIQDYVTKSTLNLGGYKNVANTVLSLVPLNSKILDFGAGPADKTALLQLLGYRCSAWDDLGDEWHDSYKKAILDFCETIGVEYRVIGSNFEFPDNGSKFNLIMLNDVLEHIHDSPKVLLSNLLNILEPGGFLLITVPNAANIRKRISLLFGRTNLPKFPLYYWYPTPFRGHVREYVKSDLEILGGYLNLNIIRLRGADHMLAILPKVIRPAYRLFTFFFSNLKDTWTFVGQKPVDFVSVRELSPNEIKGIVRGSRIG